MVSDELAGPSDRIGDRVAVAAVGDRGRKIDRPLERPEVIPERIRPARGPEADRRRDAGEQVIGGDQHTVLEQGQLTVGVARGRVVATGDRVLLFDAKDGKLKATWPAM